MLLPLPRRSGRGAVALWPLLLAQPVQGPVKRLPPDPCPAGAFGLAVSLGDDYAAVGAPGDTAMGEGAGAVYLYARPAPTAPGLQRTPASWPLVAKLLSGDPWKGNAFGTAVAVSGDRILAGAPTADCGASHGHQTECGAAYAYEPDGAGGWKEHPLVPDDASTWAWFGAAVALQGDRALVGAYGDGTQGHQAGGAYVFERQADGSWMQAAKLVASDGEAGDWLGYSVALDGERAVLGAYAGPGAGPIGSGSAYVFARDATGTWHEEGELVAAGGRAWDHLGRSLAIEGDTVVVGSHRHFASRGAAYVFQRIGGHWVQVQELAGSDSHVGSMFGAAVDLEAGSIFVGAPGQWVHAQDSGAAYRFDPTPHGWVEAEGFTPSSGAVKDFFGIPLDAHAGALLVGASRDDAGAPDGGAIHVFELP